MYLADFVVFILGLLRILESGRSIWKNISKRETEVEVPRFLPEGVPAAVFTCISQLRFVVRKDIHSAARLLKDLC